jgi:hypothetical protein
MLRNIHTEEETGFFEDGGVEKWDWVEMLKRPWFIY